MRQIVVSKLGNEPALFENSLRFGMLGEWECLKLLKILSKDLNNFVYYYGKAKWDEEEAKKYFEPYIVTYIDSSLHSPEMLTNMTKVDEFHIVLGPHAFYNAGTHIGAWETIKKSIVTERLLERVAPQIKLMNDNPHAKVFLYLSDRRFVFTAADLLKPPIEIYAQSVQPTHYMHKYFHSDDYLDLANCAIRVEPFRFETLWLYDKDYTEYRENLENPDRTLHLVVPANQVTSDDEIEYSRLDKIKEFTKFIDYYSVLGKWTNRDAVEFFENTSLYEHILTGLSHNTYTKTLKNFKYALVLFNTKDGTEIFDNNWITVKYWECVYAGCLTFVERPCGKYLPFIPESLQVANGEELRDKIQQCEDASKYKYKLLEEQNNLVLPEYFTGTYFNTWLNEKRRTSDRYNN